MAHQDWTPRVLRKTNIKTVSQTGSYGPKPISFDPTETKQPIITTRELGIAICNARKKKSYKQNDLDIRCGFAKNTVRDYENGSAIVKPEQINTMNKQLGVVLPRPKKR